MDEDLNFGLEIVRPILEMVFLKKNCRKNSNMTCFVESNPEERALIPNVMQPSPRNSIKITEIDQKRVIHALIMKNEDE